MLHLGTIAVLLGLACHSAGRSLKVDDATAPKPLCFEPEKLLAAGMTSLGADPYLWEYEPLTGSGTMRYKGPNVYNSVRVMNVESPQLCSSLVIPEAGVYQVTVTGGRVKGRRKSVKCDSGDRAGFLEQCAIDYGKECVCNDEENDVWLMVDAPHVELTDEAGHPLQNEPLKAMCKCKWNVPDCEGTTLNHDDKGYPSQFNMPTGRVDVCLMGRSTGLGVDKVCFSKLE